MHVKDTEKHIKETAKKVFFTQGRLNAKTQEIADEAKVNRALLHYYFRSRENLFEIVLKEALENSRSEFFSIISSNLSFEERIEKIVSSMVDRTIEFPYMESFIVSEIIKKPENLLIVPEENLREKFKSKLDEMQQYIVDNKLPHLSAHHFLANMFSLCVYPSVTKPLLMTMFKFNEVQFIDFINQRKEVITKLLLGKKTN